MKRSTLYKNTCIAFFSLLLYACNGKTGENNTLFTLIPAEHSNITFANTLTDTKELNVLTYTYFYNGGGVSTGDFNNDGLEDIYFSGNMDLNRLYLNKGDFKFQDVTDISGTQGKRNAWKTGVTIVDINGDGRLDIYSCRTHELFVNQGNGKDGIPRFVDKAKEYGLDIDSYSTQAVFFDFDKDSDLDMVLMNHNPVNFSALDETSTPFILKKPAPKIAIQLFRNDKGKFIDVSEKSGFHRTILTYGLGIAVNDMNNDGFPDIYLSQDYSAADYLYINNGNGTFRDETDGAIGKTSYYSMGNAITDVNNDLQPDIFSLDMLPESNHRQKILFMPDNYEYASLRVKLGLHEQYMQNMLHVNNGNGTFSEIAQLAGISNTDWSWAPLFADYDNHGWQDLFVSNGYLKDYTDLDFLKYKGDMIANTNASAFREKYLDMISKMPSSDVLNYIYKNDSNLTFSDKTTDWGLTKPCNSNGSAYVDLDNDGDLDLVINNLNQAAFIYKNNSEKQLKNNFLSIKLRGSGLNSLGLGAKVTVYTQNNKQYREQMPTQGFQSSVTPVIHFGLGKYTKADSVRIVWQSGKQQLLKIVTANQILTVNEKNASETYRTPAEVKPLFVQTTSSIQLEHKKNNINDFKRQPLLVNPMSFFGPCLAKGDINGDGLEDVYVGGGYKQTGSLYLQQKDGRFRHSRQLAFEQDMQSDDVDAVFFDANGDGFRDLYVVSGGYGNFIPEDVALKDRLYINDGAGNFKKDQNALPALNTAKSCVRVTDFNNDGSLDIFVGGRVIPGRYPETPQSAILINNGKGNFTDQTHQILSGSGRIGMVSDAMWVDLNHDEKRDLIVVGEWMPITVFINRKGKLINETGHYFDKPYDGLWNKILVDDINNDGEPDLVVGNMGLNSQIRASEDEPAELYYGDFDNNGAVDPILCFYIQGKSYPYLTRDELLDQISLLRSRFVNYRSYADADITDVFTPEELRLATRLKATTLKTTMFINTGTGKFLEKPLPIEAQFSPVFTLTPMDYDKDGHKDLLLCGNIYKARLRLGKSDANHGILLKGNGEGVFSYVPQQNSGFKLKGDVRGVMSVNNKLLFGINQSGIQAYQINK